MSSDLSAQHWDTSHPNVPIRKMTKQNSLEDKKSLSQRRCFACKKGHNIADCPKEEASKQVCQNRRVQFGKPDSLGSTKKIQNFWIVQQRLQSGN
jgi:hypothetical protein